MKIIKIALTIISFLLISQITFAAVDACPGETKLLNYSASNVPADQTCTPQAPIGFNTPPAPVLVNGAASGVWSIAVPDVAPGPYGFSLSCAAPAVSSADTLNVLDKDSETCCGTGPTTGKVWLNGACVVPVVVPTCVAPQVLNVAANTCGNPTPNGTISASPSPCTIAYNASNCASTITWSSGYTSAPNVLLDNITNFSTGVANGTQAFPYVAHGGNIFQIRDGGNVLDSVTVSGVCVNTTEWSASAVKCVCPVGKAWDGTSCEVSLTPSGTISATPASCTILPDESTCRATTTITWSTANVTNGNAKVEKTNVAETISTTALNGSALRNMISGSTLFNLWNTGPNPDVLLSSATVLASCSGNSTWVASPAPGMCECPVNTSADAACCTTFDCGFCRSDGWTRGAAKAEGADHTDKICPSLQARPAIQWRIAAYENRLFLTTQMKIG